MGKCPSRSPYSINGIDFRPLAHPYLPQSHYLITLIRAGQGQTQVWAVDVQEPLPVIPVPLRAPDEDTFLDVSKVLKDLYEQRSLDKSIDYNEAPPPPAFSEEEQEWMQRLAAGK